MGDSVLVMMPSPFHIMSAVASTVAKLRAWSRTCASHGSARGPYLSQQLLTCLTPSRLNVAISSLNMLSRLW